MTESPEEMMRSVRKAGRHDVRDRAGWKKTGFKVCVGTCEDEEKREVNSEGKCQECYADDVRKNKGVAGEGI